MRAELQKLRPSEFVVRTSLQIAICRAEGKFLDLLEEVSDGNYFSASRMGSMGGSMPNQCSKA